MKYDYIEEIISELHHHYDYNEQGYLDDLVHLNYDMNEYTIMQSSLLFQAEKKIIISELASSLWLPLWSTYQKKMCHTTFRHHQNPHDDNDEPTFSRYLLVSWYSSQSQVGPSVEGGRGDSEKDNGQYCERQWWLGLSENVKMKILKLLTFFLL